MLAIRLERKRAREASADGSEGERETKKAKVGLGAPPAIVAQSILGPELNAMPDWMTFFRELPAAGTIPCSERCLRLFELHLKPDVARCFVLGPPPGAFAALIDIDPGWIGCVDGTTEASLHGVWDFLIAVPLVQLVPQVKLRRDSADFRSTGNNRPDLLISAASTDVTLFRGEEKGVGHRLSEPLRELVTKTRTPWPYEGLDYVVCYAAAGYNVQFAVLRRNSDRRKPAEVCTDVYDLNTIAGRVGCLLATVQVARWIRFIADKIDYVEHPPPAAPIEREGGVIVSRKGDAVIKSYTKNAPEDAAHVERVLAVLDKLQKAGVPNTITGAAVTDNIYAIKLTPLGEWPPESKSIMGPVAVGEALAALECVCETLGRAHDGARVVHCDIRWPNVVRTRDGMRTLVIDWDDAVDLEQRCGAALRLAARGLDKEAHAPELVSDELVDDDITPAVDVWGIGYLIATARCKQDLPQSVVDIGKRARCTEVGRRPSVAEIEAVLRAARAELPLGDDEDQEDGGRGGVDVAARANKHRQSRHG